MSLIQLSSGIVVAIVDPNAGGRLASLHIGGVQLLVTGTDEDDPRQWGMYPMAPYAGRVRKGELKWKDTNFALEKNADPHAIHGVVFDQPWQVTQQSSTEVSMQCALGPRWPFGGFVEQKISVTSTSVWCDMSVTAGDIAMPALLGWHPWFRKPSHTQFSFSKMLQRDSSGIATSDYVDVPQGAVDDCFVAPLSPPRLTIEGITIDIDSDCSHWVVYDMPQHATCVEPQSGPPNQINDAPVVLSPHESLSRWLEIRVAV